MTLQPLFAHNIALRWRDMDSYQHVNNAEYLTLCEECRIHWFHSLAGPWRSAAAEPVVARMEMDYRKPASYPETIRIDLFLERVGSSSLTLTQTLRSSADPSVLYAEGRTVLVWINPQTGSSTPLPDFIRQATAVRP